MDICGALMELNIYSDLKYKIIFQNNWSLFLSSGIGWFDNSGDIDLGHQIEFRTGFEFNYQLHNKQSIGISFYHFSNSKFANKNPGTESILINYKISFSID
jgi:hypothetical protein